jgi:hypothetical protein
MTQLSIDFLRAARDDGIQRAADHADAVSERWSKRAGEMLERYIAAHPGVRFTSPMVRAWGVEHGLESPASKLAWGGVFQSAARRGLIVRDGFEQFGDQTMHLQTVTAWRAA